VQLLMHKGREAKHVDKNGEGYVSITLPLKDESAHLVVNSAP